jgi:two-component system OmpR family sensor kinase
MGRLFWKFFLAILFAQLAATLGVGATFWVWDQARNKADAAHIDTSPGAEALLDAAALTFHYGGEAGLRQLAASGARQPVFVLDAGGRDVLGRPVSAELSAEAARLAGSAAVRRIGAAGGRRFTVFMQRDGGMHRPGFRMGPPGPFGAPPPKGGRPPDGYRLPYITMVVGTLASLLFAALLAWYFSRPIRALRGAFEAAASGDLAPRFGAARRGRGDELADLGHDFDRMSGQLRALLENQRRLLHDVSHELRSPLARLQAAIGLAHQQPDKLEVSLARIERESVRMDQLVGELLTLARLETASALPALDDIGIAEMVAEIGADAAFEAASQGRRVTVAGATAAQVRGTPDLLWRAIDNVVRNAIKHSLQGGVVEIVLGEAAGKVLLQVRDRGPGVDSADLDTIFEPFYRSHPSANNIDGHGLGLAIARRVIDAHGGTITAANRAGGGLDVTIALPPNI